MVNFNNILSTAFTRLRLLKVAFALADLHGIELRMQELGIFNGQSNNWISPKLGSNMRVKKKLINGIFLCAKCYWNRHLKNGSAESVDINFILSRRKITWIAKTERFNLIKDDVILFAPMIQQILEPGHDMKITLWFKSKMSCFRDQTLDRINGLERIQHVLKNKKTGIWPVSLHWHSAINNKS